MTTPLLAVDIGNTTVRLGLFARTTWSAGQLPVPERVLELPAGGSWSELGGWLPQAPCRWRVASVHRGSERMLADWRAEHRPSDDYQSLQHTDLPLLVLVEHPHQVGMDRLAAAIAANQLRAANRGVIVVDAGSAITVDLVNELGAFAGGVILPGFRMAAEALAQQTDLLPLTAFSPQEDPPPLIGTSTAGAIRSGLFWGSLGAVRLLIERMAQALPAAPAVVVTGGDARRLTPLLMIPSFGATASRDENAETWDSMTSEPRFEPDLVLCGLVIAACSSVQNGAVNQ